MSDITIDIKVLQDAIAAGSVRDLGTVELIPEAPQTSEFSQPPLPTPVPSVMTDFAIIPSANYKFLYNQTRFLKLYYILERGLSWETGEILVLNTTSPTPADDVVPEDEPVQPPVSPDETPPTLQIQRNLFMSVSNGIVESTSSYSIGQASTLSEAGFYAVRCLTGQAYTVTTPTTVRITTTPSAIGITSAGQTFVIGAPTDLVLAGVQTVSSVSSSSISFTVASGSTTASSGTLSIAEPLVTVTAVVPPSDLGLTAGQSVILTGSTDPTLDGVVVVSNVASSSYQFPITSYPITSGSLTTSIYQTTAAYLSIGSTIIASPTITPASLDVGLEVGQRILVSGSPNGSVDGDWLISDVTATTITFSIDPARLTSPDDFYLSGTLYLTAYFKNITINALNTKASGDSIDITSATDSRLDGMQTVFSANDYEFIVRRGDLSPDWVAGSTMIQTIYEQTNPVTGVNLSVIHNPNSDLKEPTFGIAYMITDASPSVFPKVRMSAAAEFPVFGG